MWSHEFWTINSTTFLCDRKYALNFHPYLQEHTKCAYVDRTSPSIQSDAGLNELIGVKRKDLLMGMCTYHALQSEVP